VRGAMSGILRVVCGLLAIAWAALSLGTLVNGNFATGNLSGWNVLGSAFAVQAQGNILPIGSAYQALIGSGKDSLGDVVPALRFGKPGAVHRIARAARPRSAAAHHPANPKSNDPDYTDVPEATLESALNLPSGAIQAALPNNYLPTDGSAMYQTFTANAGDTLSFSWNFATNEEIPSQYDAALYSLQVGTNQAQVFELADTTQSSVVNQDAGEDPFTNMSGYATKTVALTVTGTYTVGFISMQTGDDAVSSATFISNVQTFSGTPITTPAPAAWSLGLLGLGFIAIYSGIRGLRRAI